MTRWYKKTASTAVTMTAVVALLSATLRAEQDSRRSDDATGRHVTDHQRGYRSFHRFPYHGRSRIAPSYRQEWYQRPYPYHLDFYRREYGGS